MSTAVHLAHLEQMIFKYINICILLELICLSSDLPDVIISICAGQLWTIRKIELLAKTGVLQKIELLLPFEWRLP